MIESLLSVPNPQGEYAINIDWKTAGIGDKEIVDLAGNVWTPSTTSFGSAVVNNAVKGLVWNCNGDVFFTMPISARHFLAQKSFVIEYEILTLGGGSQNVGGTGDYNQGISSGIGLNVGQFQDRYYQAFLMGPGTTYSRLYPLATWENKWTRVVITRTYGSGFKMSLYHDDSESPYSTIFASEIEIGNGSGYWYLFRGANTPNIFFSGWINYFRVSIKE